MLNVHTLTLGLYQTNTYLIHDRLSQSCVVIDPGYDARRILAEVSGLGLTIGAIFLTHGHFDHVGAVEELVEATHCPLWMHRADWAQFPSPLIAHFYPLANCDFTEVRFLEDGKPIKEAGMTFTPLHTPGHTAGSVCLLCENALFTGDTLFAGSCGRTDLPGGDECALSRSLMRLRALEEDCRVYPGHGAASTLAQEKQENPYLH